MWDKTKDNRTIARNCTNYIFSIRGPTVQCAKTLKKSAIKISYRYPCSQSVKIVPCHWLFFSTFRSLFSVCLSYKFKKYFAYPVGVLVDEGDRTIVGAGDFCDFVEEGTSGARGTPPPLLVWFSFICWANGFLVLNVAGHWLHLKPIPLEGLWEAMCLCKFCSWKNPLKK